MDCYPRRRPENSQAKNGSMPPSLKLDMVNARAVQRLAPRRPEASAQSARVARTSASRVSARTRALACRTAGRRSAIDTVVQRSACFASARRADIGNFTNKAWHAASNGRP